MTDALPQAVAINYVQRIVLFDDESTAPFAASFNADGERTDVAGDVVSVVVQHSSGWWLTLFEGDFEPAPTN